LSDQPNSPAYPGRRRDLARVVRLAPALPRYAAATRIVHSKLFAEACERAGVPVEFRLFPHGPHGMGLALDAPNEARRWTTQLLAWLARQWGR
jgi:acetyl esterase/lipase